jgi:hypothetical protein
LSRVSSFVSTSSSIGKTGVFASDRMRISSATSSTLPVSRFGFTVSSERACTVPVTASTYSERTLSAAAWASFDTSGRATTWQIPSRSRRSTNTTPPRSRRVAAQPMSVTVFPTWLSRSSPQ